MNQFLTQVLGSLNTALAIVLFVSGPIAALSWAWYAGFPWWGYLWILPASLISSFLLAVLVCGSLAILITIVDRLTDIEEHLRKIANRG